MCVFVKVDITRLVLLAQVLLVRMEEGSVERIRNRVTAQVRLHYNCLISIPYTYAHRIKHYRQRRTGAMLRVWLACPRSDMIELCYYRTCNTVVAQVF